MSEKPPTDTALNSLERLLLMAATESEFKEALIARRADAAEDRGFSLSASEQATLAAIPETQLRVMIENISRGSTEEKPVYASQGIRPDYHVEELTAGIRPEHGPPAACEGIRPDLPSPVRGIRPAHLLLGAAAVTTAALTAGSFCVSMGNRPDGPPEIPAQLSKNEQSDAGRTGTAKGGVAVSGQGDAAERGQGDAAVSGQGGAAETRDGDVKDSGAPEKAHEPTP